MMICTDGQNFFELAVHSMPESCGNWMSMSTISSLCLEISSRASSAVEQANTQRHSGSVCTNSVRLSRIVLLSSTMRDANHKWFLNWQRQVKPQGGAPAGLAGDFKTAAHFFQPHTHVAHAVAILRGDRTAGRRHCRRWKIAAVRRINLTPRQTSVAPEWRTTLFNASLKARKNYAMPEWRR